MEGNIGAVVGIVVVICLVCGVISGSLASSKGLPAGGYFALGLFLGVIGVLIAAVSQPANRQTAQVYAPSWYPDPWAGDDQLRWHDGWQWTGHTSAPTQPAVDARKPRPHPEG